VKYSTPSRLSAIAQQWLAATSPPPVGSLPPPQPGQQELFLNSPADIALFGGAAFCGKSFSLLLDFARPENVATPGYDAVIFRRTYPQIRNAGGLWSESLGLYPAIGGRSKESSLEWEFPAGSFVRFRHLEYEKNVYDWQGSQVVRIGFDELTLFTEYQFWYLLSRNRSACGVKPRVRATCNPDADSWVARLVDWWIDAEGYPIAERGGVLRWFVRLHGDLVWADSAEELREQFPEIEPKSFTFIPAKIGDNPIGLARDPGYLANLQAQHPVDQARLLLGNWKAKLEAGRVYNRQWFKVVPAAPQGGIEIRFWDLAATARAIARSTSFYTAGVKLKVVAGDVYLLDCRYEQLSPSEVDQLICDTAAQDGPACWVRWEREGGSAGLLHEDQLVKKLVGFNAAGRHPTGDKVSRAVPVAADAAAGRVYLVAAPWNDVVLSALQSFDGSAKPLVNDIADALSGAWAEAKLNGGSFYLHSGKPTIARLEPPPKNGGLRRLDF